MKLSALDCSQHVKRASHHLKVGQALHESAGEQWAAVCYFYSAYHIVTGALSTDPLFNDLGALKKVHPNLMESDRWTEKHSVRRGDPGFGVNQLVHLLYPEIQASYHELHGASIGVRYGVGISNQLDDLRADVGDVRKYLAEGVPRLESLAEQLETELTV